MRFTDTSLRALQPRKVAYRLFEKGTIRGFGVQVTPKGSVGFFLCYQEGRATKYKTLGNHSTMTLAQAREEAIGFRRRLDAGDVRQTGTLQHLCDAYIEDLVASGKKTARKIKRDLQRNVVNVIGADKLARDVTPTDIQRVMGLCIARGAEVLSNRIRSHIMSAFNHGLKHDYDPRNVEGVVFGLTSNPVTVVPRIGSFESIGERVLTMEELAKVWEYHRDVRYTFTKGQWHAVKLIVLFCGLRPSEVTQARWEEFDFNMRRWSIPPKRTKNGKWHILPLTDTIIKVLEDQKAWAATLPGSNREFVFPSVTGLNKPEYITSLTRAVGRLVAELEMEIWTPRDLRRTCKTWAGQAGLSKEIRDRLQNHSLNDVSSKHYDRYLYLPEKLEALEKWEKFLGDELLPLAVL